MSLECHKRMISEREGINHVFSFGQQIYSSYLPNCYWQNEIRTNLHVFLNFTTMFLQLSQNFE